MISCRETIWWKETIVAKNEIDLLIVKNDQKRGLNSTNISSAELRDDVIISVVVLGDVPIISGRNSPDVVTVLIVIDGDELQDIPGLSKLHIETPTASFLLLGGRGSGGRSLGGEAALEDGRRRGWSQIGDWSSSGLSGGLLSFLLLQPGGLGLSLAADDILGQLGEIGGIGGRKERAGEPGAQGSHPVDLSAMEGRSETAGN